LGVVRKDRLSASPPERRYLTIMFIDLVGYTELSEQLEPDDLLALSNRYHQLALAIMERFGGFVAHFLGDGVLVYFGYPTAHGNDAERALRAALEMTERLSAMDFPLSEGGTRRLAARIGVHTGLVIVGAGMMSSSPNVHGIVGEAPNLAARLQREAPQNGVVVSRDTRGLVEDLFDFAPLGARLLKGLSQPVEISQVLCEARGRIRAHPSAPKRNLDGRTRGRTVTNACRLEDGLRAVAVPSSSSRWRCGGRKDPARERVFLASGGRQHGDCASALLRDFR
jgi:class 3 adenylate cyclase